MASFFIEQKNDNVYETIIKDSRDTQIVVQTQVSLGTIDYNALAPMLESDSTEVTEIRDVLYDMIEPNLLTKDDHIAATWYSSENQALMIQEYDQAGNPLHQTNGIPLIETNYTYKTFDNFVVAANELENSN